MSEPVAERLSRFTPDRTALDRDALLFEAGRASARPNRRWAALAGALAASQLLTLALLWPRTAPPAVPLAQAPPAAPTVEPPEPPALDESAEPGSLNRLVLQSKDNNLPPPSGAADSLVPDEPPLRAFAALTAPGLD